MKTAIILKANCEEHKVYEANYFRIFAFFAFFAIISIVEVWAAEQGSIKGKVENDAGKAVKGAQVLAESDGKEAGRATTDSKGEFKLDLAPGEYQISVEAEGHKSIQLLRKYKVESGKTLKIDNKITLPVSESSSLVRGAVFDQRGYSLPGATVQIERIGAGNKDKFHRQYTTNQAGEFAFRLPDTGGQYKLTASARGFEDDTQTIELQPGESRSVAFSLKAAK